MWCETHSTLADLQTLHTLVAAELKAARLPVGVTRRLCLALCRVAYQSCRVDPATSRLAFPLLSAVVALTPSPSDPQCVTTYLELFKALAQEMDDLSVMELRAPAADVLVAVIPQLMTSVAHLTAASSPFVGFSVVQATCF